MAYIDANHPDVEDRRARQLFAAAKQEIELLQAHAVTYAIIGPDFLPIHQEELYDLQDVIEMAASFPTRYIRPGYYLDAHHNRIPPEELYKYLRLEISPAQMSLTQAYTKYIQDNLDRIGADWQPVCIEEFKESEELESYRDDEPPMVPSVDAKWHKIGEVAVDSGGLLITDPCYLSSEWKSGGTEQPHVPPIFRHKDGRVLYCTLHSENPVDGALGFSNFAAKLPEFNGQTPNQMLRVGDMIEEHPKPSGEFSREGCFLARDTEELGGQLNFSRGHAGAGVSFSSGVGDGCYDVFVRYANLKSWGKRVAEVRITMIEPNAEDEIEEFMDDVAANSACLTAAREEVVS